MSILPTSPVRSLLERPLSQKWLIDQLWPNELLALSMAVFVSTGTPCLSKHKVSKVLKKDRGDLYQCHDLRSDER